MTVKHTPGPWLVQGRTVYASNEDTYVCEADGDTLEQVEANATLIAAAPDLLKALQDLLDCPFDIDEATVAKCGLEQTMRLSPYQVVGNMSVSLQRLRAARDAVTKATQPKDTP